MKRRLPQWSLRLFVAALSVGLCVGLLCCADAAESILKVVGRSADGGQSTLTGFVVHSIENETYCLTNAHLYRDRVDRLAVIHEGKECPAEFVRGDWERDLCLVRFDSGGQIIPEFSISDSQLQKGEPGELRGFAYGREEHRRAGKVVEFMLSQSRCPVAVFDCPSYPGESGSPIVGQSGDVVAINWGSDGQILTATPGSEIAEFIRTAAPQGFCRRRQCANRF